MCYFLSLSVVPREAMLPSPEPGKVEDSDTAPLVLVQLRVQVEVQVQQRTVLLKFLLVAEGVKQHAAVLNLQANWGKQVQEVWMCLIELPELGVESYDNLGFPKLSGRVHSVVPHFGHVLELSEVLDL